MIYHLDSLSHRLAVRTALAADPTWNADFVSKFTPKVQYMINSLLIPVAGTSVDENVSKDPTGN